VTTKIIPNGSSSVYYGPSSSNETLVNNSVILTNPSKTPGSELGDDAITIYEANGISLVNTGTINSTYSALGGNNGYGVLFIGTLSQQISITNAATGVIEATGAYGDGVSIFGGTVVNYGLISGTDLFGVVMGENGGFISNASSGTIAGGGIYAFGQTTLVNAGKVLGLTASNVYGAIDLTAGGIITNLSTGTIAAEGGAYGVKITGAAGTVTNAGYIDGGSGDAVTLSAGTAGYANLVVIDPGARFRGIVDGGATAHSTLELGSGASIGTLSGFGSEYVHFGTLTFAPSAQWLFETNTANIPGVIDGFVQGDTIDITGFTATSISTLSGNKGVVLNSGATTHETISFGGTISNFEFTTGSFGTDLTTICFCVGTLIGTPDGEVQVEKLRPGDIVSTAHNGPRTVKWVGRGKVLATRGKPTAATPVIVRKGALAENVPNRDLRVTKAHSLYIDDVLIPVEFLVNHRTILWDDRAQEVEIYHVELDSHDVLIANGAPAESYRDDGNRWLFQNANVDWQLPPQEPCASVLTGGPVVDSVWRRLLHRAGPRHLPPMTDDPDLHLVVNGERVGVAEQRGSVRVFRLLCRPESVVIASRDAVPAELGLARDPRSLGVALQHIAVRQGAKFEVLKANDPRLVDGFHDYEATDDLRWTNGYAALPAGVFARLQSGGVEIVLTLAGATRDLDDGKSMAAVAAAWHCQTRPAGRRTGLAARERWRGVEPTAIVAAERVAINPSGYRECCNFSAYDLSPSASGCRAADATLRQTGSSSICVDDRVNATTRPGSPPRRVLQSI
jgi:antigen 43